MEHTFNLYPHQLSWGMTKRIALLRAFLFPSKYLLMDEPFSGLDLNIKHTLMQLFINLWNKYKPTVILVSHDLDECLLLANTINLIDKKPIEINDRFLIKSPLSKRDLTSKELIATKKVLLEKIKRW
jgi:ABC-type nitrate/sulfonate/bicarbonate transport system ATPase subunit